MREIKQLMKDTLSYLKPTDISNIFKRFMEDIEATRVANVSDIEANTYAIFNETIQGYYAQPYRKITCVHYCDTDNNGILNESLKFVIGENPEMISLHRKGSPFLELDVTGVKCSGSATLENVKDEYHSFFSMLEDKIKIIETSKTEENKVESHKIAIQALEENERLKVELQSAYNNAKNIWLLEVNRLKTELKKSIQLPCNVGDTVYCIMNVDDNKEVWSWELKTLTNIVAMMGNDDFGKTVFLTLEEAEWALQDKTIEEPER